MTDVEVAQMSLDHIGEESAISSISNPITHVENVCKRSFATLRRAALRDHIWNFAIVRQALAVTTAPVSGFTFAYTLPAGNVRALSVNEDETSIWAVEGPNLVTDDATVILKFIKDIDNPELWDPLFLLAFTTRWAAYLAIALKQDAALSLKLLEIYEQLKSTAQTADGQEGSTETFISTTLTTEVRGS